MRELTSLPSMLDSVEQVVDTTEQNNNLFAAVLAPCVHTRSVALSHRWICFAHAFDTAAVPVNIRHQPTC